VLEFIYSKGHHVPALATTEALAFSIIQQWTASTSVFLLAGHNNITNLPPPVALPNVIIPDYLLTAVDFFIRFHLSQSTLIRTS
jgi:hypothetical protein